MEGPQYPQYTFQYISHCNMCGSHADSHKTLGKRLSQSQGLNPRKKIGITTTVVKCNYCGLIFSNPMPIPKSIQDHYGVPPESYWNSDYFAVDKNYFQVEIKTFKKLYPFSDGNKALDIGAGLGKCMISLNASGFDAFGIEPSKTFHEKAIKKMGIHPDRLTLSSIENAELPANNFDFITFGAVLEHLFDPAGAIDKAMSWLKVGGLMHIEVPSSNWLVSGIINSYYRLRGLDYVTNLSPMSKPFHLYEFGLKSFAEHAKNKKHEIFFHNFYVCKTYMPKMMDFILVPYMRITKRGMQLCVWLRKG